MKISLAIALALIFTASVSSAQELANTTYYQDSPAPSPGSCPEGTSNATLVPEVTEGPYYIDEDLFRSNVTEAQGGIPLEIRYTVLDTSCNPVVGALIDIWHCNATGTYSGYTAMNPGGSLAPASSRKMLAEATTDNTTFLRGTTATDSNGVAVFYTIVPGWYSGRATHVHNKVHIVVDEGSDIEAEYNSSRVSHTGQFFFEDSLLDAIYALYPYSRHTAGGSTGRTALADDSIFTSADDYTQIFTINYVDSNDISAGLVASVTAVVDPTTTAAATNSGMGGGMGMSPGMGMGGGGSGMGMGAGGPGMPAFGGMPIPPSSGMPTLPLATGRKLLQNL